MSERSQNWAAAHVLWVYSFGVACSVALLLIALHFVVYFSAIVTWVCVLQCVSLCCLFVASNEDQSRPAY